MTKTLIEVFFACAPAPGGMDYKDHAAAWSNNLWAVLQTALPGFPSFDEGYAEAQRLIPVAREMGLFCGESEPRRFQQVLEKMRAERHALRVVGEWE